MTEVKGNDVSSFRGAYKTAITSDLPPKVTIQIGESVTHYDMSPVPQRYGTNPHQPFAFYVPGGRDDLTIGAVQLLKSGKDGLSQTNLEDASRTGNILKYFGRRKAC